MASTIEDSDLTKEAIVYLEGSSPGPVPTHATIIEALRDIKVLPEEDQRVRVIKVKAKPPFCYEDFKEWLT